MLILGWYVDQALIAIIAAAAATGGVAVAYSQVRDARRAAQLQAVTTLWDNFDRGDLRELRARIHQGLPRDPALRPPPDQTPPDLWYAIEATATAMDRVGSLLFHRLLADEFVFERYLEVIIPLWDKVQPYVDYRRGEKGSGWRFFGPLSRSHEDAFRRRWLRFRRRWPRDIQPSLGV